MEGENAIMKFELKQFGITGAAGQAGDVLVVLVPKSFKAAGGVVSDLIAAAVKAGDFEAKSGKTLQMYRPAGIAATQRSCLISVWIFVFTGIP